MRNNDLWRPTKFIVRHGKLAASPDRNEVGVRSRLVCDLVAEAYQDALVNHAKGSLIDIGCGSIPLYGVYKDLVDQVTCVDWGNTLHRNRHLDHELDLNEELPFPDGSFDTVLATDVLEHIVKPELLWSEISRILRPNGKLILGVPFLYRIHEEPHDYFRYTRFKLMAFCMENKFDVIELREYGGPLSVVLDVVGKNISSQRLAAAFQHIARAIASTSLGKRVDARQRSAFPLGYCLIAQRRP